MNILLITSLYPSRPDANPLERTFALHDIAKYWSLEEKVLVIRPRYFYLSEMFGKNKKYHWREFRKRSFSLDGVTVIIYPVLKIPKVCYLYSFLLKYINRLKFNPDIVITHFDRSLEIGYRYTIKNNIPFIAGLHIAPDLMESNPTAFNRRCGRILYAASAIACRSLYIYNKIKMWYPQYQEKCFVAPSGIDEKLIRHKGFAVSKLSRWRNHGSSPVHILTVSILVKRKNIDTVLKALALLKDNINWQYTIIGEGEERSSLEALASHLGIADRVAFKGAKSHRQVMEEMEQSHIFVMVSHLETFGLVYLEALAAGNIVIGSSGEGIEGVMENGKSGFLSPAGEVEPLKNILEKIILHLPASELENILTAGLDTVSRYTEKKVAQNYLNKLKSMRPGDN